MGPSADDFKPARFSNSIDRCGCRLRSSSSESPELHEKSLPVSGSQQGVIPGSARVTESQRSNPVP
jgi:hypothetical protein